uniref:16S rRNA (guanine(1405)-N(7))-methyltransferase n=1 Tax=Thermogemmatispora argillosa TaxID=2045280 RepID=A0A455T6L7_9CHLR|nr:16S rRNA methyltransferase [Thermogemmatispora argillosa]
MVSKWQSSESSESSKQLRQLVEAVRASRKYRFLYGGTIAYVGARELARRANLEEAIKATKRRLHQIAGMYLAGEAPYARWLEELRLARESNDQEQLRAACRRVMSWHTSTRERLAVLPTFYERLLADLPSVRRVLDVACGFHPLALPWMPFFRSGGSTCYYYACDIYEDLASFLQEVLKVLGVPGEATVCDIVQTPPDLAVDLAFVLKVLPCLEHIEPEAGLRLLQAIQARYLLVSFPGQSLGGGKRGMATYYEARFRSLVADCGWRLERFAFPGELVFRIEKE